MFREMLRKKQLLSEEESLYVLRKCTSGVLAVSGDDGYPYAVPLSYVYHDSKIYFHSAVSGHKIDGINKNAKVSFCVTEKDDVVPHKYTTYFRSVIVFGKARIIEDNAEKRTAIELLAAKYSPNDEEGRLKEIDSGFKRLCMIELTVEHMTGKEAKELVNLKK